MLVAAAADGTLAGYADVGGGDAEGEAQWIDLRPAPGRDDVIEPLFAAIERRADERRPGHPLRAFLLPTEEMYASVLERRGYRVVRSSFRMVADLKDEPSAPSWPDGLEPRPVRPGEERAVYDAANDAFADHWDHHPPPFEEWLHVNTGMPPHDPALWWVVEDGGALAAVCLCRPYLGEERHRGWVAVLGVRPAWRRRGLARALLLYAFRAFRERGSTEVGLGVDAESTTGAVRLYESVGMRARFRVDIWERGV